MSEIKFQKYKTRGAGYHWEQVSNSLRKRNIFVVARYKLILKLIKNEIKQKRILDIGCGDGILSYLLTKNGGRVIGIDSSEEAIKFAKEKCRDLKNIDFLKGSAYRLPFEDRSFDYIISSEVIEHLKYPEKMLSEVKRVWSKQGKIIISTPIRFTEIPLDKMHYQEFFEDEFKKLLEKYFGNIEVVKSHPLFWMEFQDKVVFGRSLPKLFLNCLNLLFGFNPFLKKNKWKCCVLQTVIISK